MWSVEPVLNEITFNVCLSCYAAECKSLPHQYWPFVENVVFLSLTLSLSLSLSLSPLPPPPSNPLLSTSPAPIFQVQTALSCISRPNFVQTSLFLLCTFYPLRSPFPSSGLILPPTLPPLHDDSPSHSETILCPQDPKSSASTTIDMLMFFFPPPMSYSSCPQYNNVVHNNASVVRPAI